MEGRELRCEQSAVPHLPREELRRVVGDPEKDTEAAIMAAYQSEMRALNAMDFDDLIILGVQLLEDHDDVVNSSATATRM